MLLSLVLFLWAMIAVAGMGSSGQRVQVTEMIVPVVQAAKPSATMVSNLTNTPRPTAIATATAAMASEDVLPTASLSQTLSSD